MLGCYQGETSHNRVIYICHRWFPAAWKPMTPPPVTAVYFRALRCCKGQPVACCVSFFYITLPGPETHLLHYSITAVLAPSGHGLSWTLYLNIFRHKPAGGFMSGLCMQRLSLSCAHVSDLLPLNNPRYCLQAVGVPDLGPGCRRPACQELASFPSFSVSSWEFF